LERGNLPQAETTLEKMQIKYPEAGETEKIAEIYADKVAETE
jgi:hypothetical protein